MVARSIDLDNLPTLTDIRVEKARRHLRDFIAQAWEVLEPQTPFRAGWHIDAICEHLEAVRSGEIRNLLINVPPRTMKSLTASVFFPAWCWIDEPALRFLYSSYSQDLATDHSVATRRVIQSDWYQERWGDRFSLAPDQNLKTKFENDHRGTRQATSVGGTGTGKGGDIIVCDDPHNVKEAESEAIRNETLRWWDQVMSTRFNNPMTGRRIIVMQRVHEDDLSGHVLEQGGYEHLCLPMEYEPTTMVTGIGWKDPRSEEGELLAPDRFGPAEVEDLKKRLGSRATAGQLQQRPSPSEGGTFKTRWWNRYRELPMITRAEIAVDSAFKDGVANDYSVFALWGTNGMGGYYLIWVWREKVEFPELIRLGHTTTTWAAAKFPSLKIPLVPEDKASAQSAIQVWRRPYYTESGVLPKLAVIPFPVAAGESKLARAEGVTPIIEGGQTFIPESAPWLDLWLNEHNQFPTGKHDDQVDTTSIALARLSTPARVVSIS